jgi:hypothetical protein
MNAILAIAVTATRLAQPKVLRPKPAQGTARPR